IALSSTFATGSLAACGANFQIASAWSVGRLRIRSTTRRAFIGVTRTCVARAKAVRTTSGSVSVAIVVFPVSPCSGPPAAAVVLDVALERARGRELAQLVPDHGLGHEHRNVFASVVHGDC